MLKKIRQMLKTQEGFTLVELMIVVVILGILAGIGIQQYGNVQQRARQAADDANRKILMSAANMYLMLENPSAEDLTAADFAIKKKLVPQYLDAWPENPTGKGEYVVKITITEDTTNGDVLYTVEIEPAELEVDLNRMVTRGNDYRPTVLFMFDWKS